EEYLARAGIADLALFAPEPEFFVFDDVRFGASAHEVFFRVDTSEARHNGATRYENGNPGHRPAPGGGYFAASPRDALADLRAEMATVLAGMGFERVHQHHEAAAGQCEVGFDPAPLLKSADRMQALKYAVHNVAASYGKTATFMPMPTAEGSGLGLHVHQSLRQGGKHLFAGTGYADLSEVCLHYVGGILHHARALNAFTNPTTNSYRRLVPGAGTPTLLAYSARNRSAAVRIPHAAQAEGKRVEVRFADPAANPYLALAALLMAGIDGIERRLDPGEAMDRNLYDLPPEELGELPHMCRSLGEALEALDSDREFLVKGEVFTDDLIDAYLALKTDEAAAVARTPHPVEFELYYSV
ncbi:MAG TPA: glutamine synthetase, partial [Geminicoccaceae bacterium]|nr:glutamine synthetase [Geminicoccaceae bacterium]